jgi:hypothetical protein
MFNELMNLACADNDRYQEGKRKRIKNRLPVEKLFNSQSLGTECRNAGY